MTRGKGFGGCASGGTCSVDPVFDDPFRDRGLAVND